MYIEDKRPTSERKSLKRVALCESFKGIDGSLALYTGIATPALLSQTKEFSYLSILAFLSTSLSTKRLFFSFNSAGIRSKTFLILNLLSSVSYFAISSLYLDIMLSWTFTTSAMLFVSRYFITASGIPPTTR